MAKSTQERWIGFLGLLDLLTERWEELSFKLYDLQEEIMERGEEADEDFRAFLKEISRKKPASRPGGAPPPGGDGEGGPAPALEQTRATPLRESLKRGQMSQEKANAAEVLEQELDSVIEHLEP